MNYPVSHYLLTMQLVMAGNLQGHLVQFMSREPYQWGRKTLSYNSPEHVREILIFKPSSFLYFYKVTDCISLFHLSLFKADSCSEEQAWGLSGLGYYLLVEMQRVWDLLTKVHLRFFQLSSEHFTKAGESSLFKVSGSMEMTLCCLEAAFTDWAWAERHSCLEKAGAQVFVSCLQEILTSSLFQLE